MQHHMGISTKDNLRSKNEFDNSMHRKLLMGNVGDKISYEVDGQKVTSGNVKKHIEDDLLKNMNLDQEDLNDI